MTTTQEIIGLATMAALWMLGITRIRSMLWGLAGQGVAFGALLLLRAAHEKGAGDAWLGCALIAVKGLAIPLFLNWSAARMGVVRDRGAGVAPALAMLIGAAVLFVCHFQSARFSAAGSLPDTAGLSMALVLIGLMTMMTRRTAMAVLIGFLVLDNGIFAYAFSQTPGLPIVIELGVLFDLFMGVLLAGLVLFRINKSFEHMDVVEMRELQE